MKTSASNGRHIGIVACSAEGAALCYRTICIEAPALIGDPWAHPEVALHGESLAEYMRRIERGDWEGVAELMLRSADRLAKAGADFLICPDNTIHQAMGFVRPRSPLPWLHIAEVVAEQAARLDFRKPAVLGTKWLVQSDVYPAAYVRPRADEREELSRIIMDELVCGVFKPESVGYYQRVIERLKGEGCDAVVLGCTEIPLIIDDSNSPLPVLDSTRLLARAALRRALES
jgi:aspartate racemase